MHPAYRVVGTGWRTESAVVRVEQDPLEHKTAVAAEAVPEQTNLMCLPG